MHSPFSSSLFSLSHMSIYCLHALSPSFTRFQDDMLVIAKLINYFLIRVNVPRHHGHYHHHLLSYHIISRVVTVSFNLQLNIPNLHSFTRICTCTPQSSRITSNSYRSPLFLALLRYLTSDSYHLSLSLHLIICSKESTSKARKPFCIFIPGHLGCFCEFYRRTVISTHTSRIGAIDCIFVHSLCPARFPAGASPCTKPCCCVLHSVISIDDVTC